MYTEKFLQQVQRKLIEQGITNSKLRDTCIDIYEGEIEIFKIDREGGMFYASDNRFRMGSGMSLTMTDISETVGISNPMVYGIAIGIIGMFMAIINYPIYKGILGSRRRKYADKIIAISDKIMKG